MHEYPGYDDEKILDLRLERIVQMVETINERKQEEFEQMQKVRLVESELAVKHMVMGMAVAAQSKEGGKWLQNYVGRINFRSALRKPGEPERDDEKKELPSTAQVMAAFGAGPDGLVGKRAE